MVGGGLDPVEAGHVESLARPGGNITGLATLRPELSGKRLELLKEMVPRLSRVALFASPTSADYTQIVKELDLAAAPLTVKLEHLVVRSAKEFEAAFQAADSRRAEAALVRLPGPVMDPNRTQFKGLAAKRRLPVIYERAREVGSRRAYVLPYKRS